MLHNVKNSGTNRAHHYPKVMLAFMLVLQHWRETNYPGYTMMMNNMGVYNEELGELTFAILARSVLGDHTKDDFDKMNSLFRLLPVYRDVKADVVADNNASNSLNWRHKIIKEGEEVRTTELFFKQAIRQMVSGTYTSYDGSVKSYSNAFNAGQHKTIPTNGAVFMSKTDLMSYVDRSMQLIKDDMNTNFLYPYKHIWPECINPDDDFKHNTDVVAEIHPSYEQKEVLLHVDGDDGVQTIINEEDEEDEEDEGDEDDDKDQGSEADLVDPDQGSSHPYDDRTWNSWGRINIENTMTGKRQRLQVQRFQYTQRRRGAKFPTLPSYAPHQ